MLGYALWQATEDISKTLGNMYEYFSTNTGRMEDYQALGPQGQLLYTGTSLLGHFKLSATQDEDEVIDLDELDISYPGNVERSFSDLFGFAYLMAFHFLAEVT